MKKLRQDNSTVWMELGEDLANSLIRDVLSLLNVWSGINIRCNSPGQRNYELYGAKGIGLCKEWSTRRGQIKFVMWAIKNGWKHGLVVDRKNGKKGYSPKNCRLVTQQQNAWNKSNNRMLSYAGETKCSAEWGNDPRCVIHSSQFQQRVKMGWGVEEALLTPLKKQRLPNQKFTYRNREMTLVEWSRNFNIKRGTLYTRIFVYGWDIARALETPVQRKERRK